LKTLNLFVFANPGPEKETVSLLTASLFPPEPTTEEITVRHEDDGDIIATRTQSFKNPDGSVKKVLTVEKMRKDGEGNFVVFSFNCTESC
jgi:hypothetical protein